MNVKGILIEGRDGQEYLLGFERQSPEMTGPPTSGAPARTLTSARRCSKSNRSKPTVPIISPCPTGSIAQRIVSRAA
jgi:hypothetical protein